MNTYNKSNGLLPLRRRDVTPGTEVGWTSMAAVMRLVNRSTLGSAMGQHYLAFSSVSKVLCGVFLLFSLVTFLEDSILVANSLSAS